METRGEFSNLFRTEKKFRTQIRWRHVDLLCHLEGSNGTLWLMKNFQETGHRRRSLTTIELRLSLWNPPIFCRELFVQILCSFSIIERSLVFSFLLLLLLYLWMIFFNSLKNKKLLFLLWNVIAREARGNDKYFRDVIRCSRTAPSH